MESSSSSIAANSLYYWNYFNLFLLRPILAISFALFFILLGKQNNFLSLTNLMQSIVVKNWFFKLSFFFFFNYRMVFGVEASSGSRSFNTGNLRHAKETCQSETATTSSFFQILQSHQCYKFCFWLVNSALFFFVTIQCCD